MGLMAELRKWYIKTIPGMNNKVEDLDLKDRWVEVAQNCRFEQEPGAVDKRACVTYLNTASVGSYAMTGLYRYYTSSGGAYWVGLNDTFGIYISDTGTTANIRTGLTTGKRASFVTYKDLLICSNGYDNPWVWDGDTTNLKTWELGALKAITSTASGSADTGAIYYYAVTMGIGTADQYVSGAVSNSITSTTSGSLALSHIPLGPVGTDKRRIYRTEGGGSSLKLLVELTDNTTTTYADTKADAALGAAYPSVTDDMPKGSMLTLHRERLFISGNTTYPNKIYYSNVYLPHYIQETTNLDYMDISPDDGDEIMGIPIQLGVMVCIKKNTIRKLHITSPVSGADPTTWYADDPIAWIGCVAPWSVTQTPNGVVFLGWDHWYLFDGAGAKPVFDEFDTNDMLPGNYSDVVGFYHNGNFIAAYTDRVNASLHHDRIMRYNFKREALSYDNWTSSTLTGANCFASRVGDDEAGDLYYGDSATGYVVKEQDTELTYKLRTKTEVNAGTASTSTAADGIFIGGTENEPYITLGATSSASAIPENICFFWDTTVTSPGTGWTEVTGYQDRLIKISATALTTAAGTSHTHTLSGSISMWYGTTCNLGDGSPNAIAAHTHEVSSASAASTPLPRHVKYRLFKRNATGTEYEFPDGAIVMWDQSTPPTGWVQLSTEVGYYVVPSTADLALVSSSTHSHTFNIPTGTAGGYLAQSDSGENGPRWGHNHMVTGTTSQQTLDSWELDHVAVGFIKKIGESDTWDGVDKYCYALYCSAGTPSNGWIACSATYEGYALKVGTGTPTVVMASSSTAYVGSHTHVVGTFTTSTESASWGNDGYHATGYEGPHTHSVTLSAASSTAGSPPSVTMSLYKKILGQMKDYNKASTQTYTAGTWTSPVMEISAESLDKIYWNEDIEGSDNVQFYTRAAATATACTAASWSAALSDPNGSIIASTANTFFQYKAYLTATDSMVTNPLVYFTNGYVCKFNYSRGATSAETSVNFIYNVGFRNFNEPTLDKLFKKISTVHEGSNGSFILSWSTENATGAFNVSLASDPERWDSYFQDTAFGKQIDVTITKNDLYDFRISEVEGYYSPFTVIV